MSVEVSLFKYKITCFVECKITRRRFIFRNHCWLSGNCYLLVNIFDSDNIEETKIRWVILVRNIWKYIINLRDFTPPWKHIDILYPKSYIKRLFKAVLTKSTLCSKIAIWLQKKQIYKFRRISWTWLHH